MIDKINDEFIVYCTNNSKEERQQVYKFLVDNRNYDIQYLSKNYPIIVCNKQHGASNWDTLIQYYNGFNTKKDIPVYTFEQFKEMYLDEFILPEEWCVKADKYNYDSIFKWACFSWNWCEDIFVTSKGTWCREKPENFIEIKFEQFKKYVLKEDNMENKKLIGYKLIKPYYKKAALKICDTVANWENSLKEYDISIDQKNYINKLQDAGVFDLWFEPVYEDEFKKGDWVTFEVNKCVGELACCKTSGAWDRNMTLPIDSMSTKTFSFNSSTLNKYAPHFDWAYGGTNDRALFRKATPEEIKNAEKTIVKMYSSNKGKFEIEVVDGKAYYKPENKELPKEWIKSIIGSYHHWRKEVNTNYPYDIKVDGVDVGCYSKTKKEDWEKVYKLLK